MKKRKRKTSESSLERALFKKVGHSKTRWRILGNYFSCFTFPVFVGINQNLRKSGGSGYLLGKVFHNEGNTNIGTGGVFSGFFPSLHKHRRKHLDFTLQKLAKIHN